MNTYLNLAREQKKVVGQVGDDDAARSESHRNGLQEPDKRLGELEIKGRIEPSILQHCEK